MYSKAEIKHLIERFENRQLPKVEWTHEAHLVVAIWYTWHHDEDEAMNLVRDFIWNHNESVGTANSETDGYHESITKFWVYVGKRFLESNEFEGYTEACTAFIDSKFASSKHPLQYYTADVLFSLEARRNWVEPDLKRLSSTLS